MLEHMAIAEVTGKDAKTFLQGQLTCDVLHLPAQQWNLAAHCLPNGRVIAVVWLLPYAPDHFFLAFPADLPLISRLKKFTLRQDVAIHPRPEKLHITSDKENHADAYPLTETNLYAALTEEIDHVENEQARAARILAGVPAIYSATSERFLPQMLNLMAFNGLSLNKGCYIGQEGIARAQYKSQLHRHLVQALCKEPIDSLSIGQTITNNNNKPIGIVIDYGKNAQGIIVQAVMEDDYVTTQQENNLQLIFQL